MNVILETTDHLTRDEMTAVQIIADTIKSRSTTLEDASNWLRNFPAWFIYRGGSHVALHKASGDPRRIMLVTA